MASNTRQELGRAFELIKQEQLGEAVKILKPITEAQPNNADAWWLLANASEEPRDARKALVQVLKINPSYPKARGLLDQLNEMFPPRDDELMMMMDLEDDEIPLPSGTPETFDGSPREDDAFGFENEDEREDEIDSLLNEKSARSTDDDFGLGEDEDPFAEVLTNPKRSRSSSPWRLILLVILVLLLVGALAIVVLGGGDDDTPTDEADTNTGSAQALAPVNLDAVNAENVTVLEDVRTSVQGDVQANTGVPVESFYTEVDGGYALIARVCGQADPNLPRIASDAMTTLALRVGTTAAVHPDLTMVGVSIEDCATNDVLYRAMSSLQAAIDLSNNPNDAAIASTFRSTWSVSN